MGPPPNGLMMGNRAAYTPIKPATKADDMDYPQRIKLSVAVLEDCAKAEQVNERARF
jgi:hypothetical protein